jgi:hypothetical protein
MVGVAGLLVGRESQSAAATVRPSRHVVQAGETLWQIAREGAGPEDPRPVIQAIREMNGLGAESFLTPGMTLLLP